MTGKRKMGILAVILVVLIAANWLLGQWNQKQEEKEEEAAEAEIISLLDVEEITAYSYTDGETEMSFAREDGTWYWQEDTEIPMSQSTIQNTADEICQMTAERKLEDPDDLSDYGLEDPLYTITFRDGDGNESAIYIGNGAGENYYATVGDEGEVFTISSNFQYWMEFDLANLVQCDTVPSIGSGNLLAVTVTEDGEDTVYEDEDQLAELAGGWGTLTLTDCVDYHVTDDKLSEYGLDEDQRIVASAKYTDSDTDTEEEYVIYIGSLDDSGEYRYVLAEGSSMVCQVDATVIQNLMTPQTSE